MHFLLAKQIKELLDVVSFENIEERGRWDI